MTCPNCAQPTEKICETGWKEIIICSAILAPDGNIIKGHRHHDCIHTISGIPKYKVARTSKDRMVQGFVTSQNRFVDRTEAKKIAIEAGQIIATTNSEQLFSEDLY